MGHSISAPPRHVIYLCHRIRRTETEVAATYGSLQKIGCFGLTEPVVGSGAAGGLTTTAKKDGDSWVLNGQKKWIGNAPWCDISIIWAHDPAALEDTIYGFNFNS